MFAIFDFRLDDLYMYMFQYATKRYSLSLLMIIKHYILRRSVAGLSF